MTHLLHARREAPQQLLQHHPAIVREPCSQGQRRRRCVEWRIQAGRWALRPVVCVAIATLVFALELWSPWGRSEAGWDAAARSERILALACFPEPAAVDDRGWRADAAVRDLKVAAAREHVRRVRVSVGHGVWPVPRVGECHQLVLALRPPRAAGNPGGIDMERVYFAARLEALASVRASPLNRALPDGGASWFQRGRQRLLAAVDAQGVDRDADALLLGLAAGLTDRIADTDWRVFNATGVSHLIAISGTHVTGLAALLYVLARWLWGGLARCGWRWDRDLAAGSFALLGALGYALFAGFSVPTQRTLLMLAVWRVARSGAREVGAGQILALALLAVLLIDARAPLSAGFWLSFVAMGILLWCFPGQARSGGDPLSWVRLTLRTQWCMTLALAPLTAGLFASVPLAGLFANLWAIPVFTLLLVPLALLASVLLLLETGAGAWLLQAFTAAHGIVARVLEAMAAWPWAVWVPPAGVAAPLALTVLALTILPAWPLRLRVLVLGIGLVAAGGAHSVSARHAPVLQLLALDSGQGMAIILRTRDHAVLVDTGDSWQTRGAMAAQRVLPALKTLDVRRLDLVVLGRPTRDRAEGLAQLAAALPLTAVAAPRGWWLDRPGAMGCGPHAWRRDGVEWSLWPAGSVCAVRVRAGGRDFWVAHTLNAADESALAQLLQARTGDSGDATALLVLRRGALRSGPAHVLRALWPAATVLAAGRASATAAPVPSLGGPVLRTGDLGAVQATLRRDGQLSIAAWRVAASPWPWRAPRASLL